MTTRLKCVTATCETMLPPYHAGYCDECSKKPREKRRAGAVETNAVVDVYELTKQRLAEEAKKIISDRLLIDRAFEQGRIGEAEKRMAYVGILGRMRQLITR